MKRDMGLIRKLLRYAEERAEGFPLEAPEYRSYSAAEVHYHLGLCRQAGYLEASESTYAGHSFPRYLIVNLTWRGHEELERLNDEACVE